MKGIHDVRKKAEAGDEAAEAVRIWDCGSPLYDSYELVALSHVVERHFMVLPYLSGSRKPADHEACGSSSSLRSTSEPDEASASSVRRSSVLSFLSEAVRKRKRKMDVQRKEKAAKKQKTGISKIFQCRWKK